MGAAVVSGWEALCQQFAPAFTRPTLISFLHIVTGWVLCRSRPTVTNLICTIGSSLLSHAARHWTVYEKFFYRAAWSLPEISGLLLTRVVVALIDRCAIGSQIDLDEVARHVLDLPTGLAADAIAGPAAAGAGLVVRAQVVLMRTTGS